MKIRYMPHQIRTFISIMKPNIFAALLLLSLISGCAGSDEAQIKDAFSKYYSANPICWSVSNMDDVLFPIVIARSSQVYSVADHPIIADLILSDKVIVSQIETSSGANVEVISLTTEGDAAEVWSEENGFCVGSWSIKKLIKVTSADGNNYSKATVEANVIDQPEWVQQISHTPLTQSPGMRSLTEKTILMEKLIDGWFVAGCPRANLLSNGKCTYSEYTHISGVEVPSIAPASENEILLK